MSQRNIISVVGDLESFLDSLLAHTKEGNCQHSVSDFLQEYFDNKNGRRAASQQQYLQTRANTTSATPTSQEGEDDHY